MATCEVCGNDYDQAMTIEKGGSSHVFDSFECAIHALDDDFEVIPMPGHTPGSTAYLWQSGEHRFLFTADTIVLRDGDWRAAVLPTSDRAAYLESLALLRELDFDVLVPWIAAGPYSAMTDGADARRRIDAIIDRERRGAGA